MTRLPEPVNASPLERDTILRRATELGASDLLITAGHTVMVQRSGVLEALPGSPVLSPLDSRRLAESFLTPALHERFVRDLELDTRHYLPGVAHFRVNLFIQRGHWGAAVRIIPLHIPLPSIVRGLAAFAGVKGRLQLKRAANGAQLTELAEKFTDIPRPIVP